MNKDFDLFREKKPFLVGNEANRHLIETKLVDILEDFKLKNTSLSFPSLITEGKLTLLTRVTASQKKGILKTMRHQFKYYSMLL